MKQTKHNPEIHHPCSIWGLLDVYLETRMWNKLDNIVAVSEECSNTFTKEFPDLKDKKTVIENILSPSFIKEQAIVEISEEIRKKKETTVLVTVGRLLYAKGLDLAVKACRKLVDRGHEVEWYVVGYGPLEEELISLIQELNVRDHFFLLGKKQTLIPI